jgi:hypothetical protein
MELAVAFQNALHILEQTRVRPILSCTTQPGNWPARNYQRSNSALFASRSLRLAGQTLKPAIGGESTVRVVCASLAGAAPELLLFFSTCKAQLLDC